MNKERDYKINLAKQVSKIYMENNFKNNNNVDPGEISLQYSYALSHLLEKYGVEDPERVIAENFSAIAMFGSTLYSKTNSNNNMSLFTDLDQISDLSIYAVPMDLYEHSLKSLKSRWTSYISVSDYAYKTNAEIQDVVSKSIELGIYVQKDGDLLSLDDLDKLNKFFEVKKEEEFRNPFL